MKTKTKFDSTSDARNLINSVIEKFPKGPERDGLQTKLREFYNCFVGAMRLPQGYDRSKVIEEGTQNLHAAQRIADQIDKQNGNAKFRTMISILASNLTDLKRDHSKTDKVENKFYGKRVVKGIFARAKKNSRIGSKSMFALNKAEAINEVKVLKLAISKLEPQLEMYKNRLKEAVKYYKSLVKGEGSFSRTGAKAKFATVKSQGHTFRVDHFDGDEYKIYMLLDGEFEFIKKTEQPQRWIEANVRSGDPSKWLPSAMSRTGTKAKFAIVGDIVKVRQGHKFVKGEIVKDNGDGTYMIELPNQLYSDGRKIIERVSEARLLLARTGSKVFK